MLRRSLQHLGIDGLRLRFRYVAVVFDEADLNEQFRSWA
jgi:hypothetical protein